MRTSCRELKRISRENLTFHYTVPLGAFVLVEVITMILESPFTALLEQYSSAFQYGLFYVAEFLILLIAMVMIVGLYYLHLNIARKKETRISQVFYGFRNCTEKYLLYVFLMLVISFAPAIPAIAAGVFFYYRTTGLGMAVLVVAGVVSLILEIFLQLQFQLLFFVAIDGEELSVREVFRRNNALIFGNRKRLFYLDLSFAGMVFLSILSLGIGFLWVIPYMFQTLTNFYLDVSGELSNQESMCD